MFSVPDQAPIEDKAICALVNQGLEPKLLFRAAYTFYRASLESSLANHDKIKVKSGLFQDTLLYPETLASQLLPKVYGTYEKEVQDYLQEHSNCFDRFIDIGCAEGYYLAGVAKWKQIPCIGIDVDPRSETAVGYVAAENKLQGLISFSKDISQISSFLTGSLACLIDVDGSELSVLNQVNQFFDRAPFLERARLITESDSGGTGRQNTAEIIEFLCHSGWTIETILRQDPRNRFSGFCSELSFLEQVVRGAEGRPGGQCWIVASKSYLNSRR